MTLNLITLTTVKTHLGITAATYDSPLTALIPVVSADIRKILNTQYDEYTVGTFTEESTSALLGCETKLGQVLDSPYLAADTYVSSYNPLTGYYTLSAAASSNGNYYYPTVTIAQWPTIAAMIWYKYTQQNTSKVDDRSITSIGAGPTSISYSDKEINNKWRYPQRLISDLGTPFASIK